MFNCNDKNEINLSEHELQKFQKDGVIVIKNFYSLTSEILPKTNLVKGFYEKL